MRWSYKTVHYEFKKEGLLGSAFLDESEVEKSLNEYGKAGWELVSMLDATDGVIAVFKQPFAVEEDFMVFDRPEKKRKAPEAMFRAEPEDDYAQEEDADVLIVDGDDPVEIDEYEVIEEPAVIESRDSEDDRDVGAIRIE